MRVLVIGETGLIGRFVTVELLCHGHSVAVVHRGRTASSPDVMLIPADRTRLTEAADRLHAFAPTW